MVAPRLMIAAAAPLGEALLRAAQAAGWDCDWFHTPSSRDPTLELPAAVLARKTTLLVLADPDREEPSTLELVREAGAAVVAWVIAEPARFPTRHARLMLSRHRWIVRAADAVAVTVPRRANLFRDRSSRPAGVVAVPRDLGDLAAVGSTLRVLVASAAADAHPLAEGSR